MMDGAGAANSDKAYTGYELTLAEAGAARPLSLLHVAETPEAVALVAAAAALAGAQEQRKRPRGAVEMTKLREAVGAVLGGVLAVAWKTDGLVYRSMRRDAFIGERVAYRQARAALYGLRDAGLIRHYPGISFDRAALFDGPPVWEGIAARYGATDALRALAAAHGIGPDNVGVAFRIDWPAKPPKVADGVVMRALSSRLPGERRKRKDDRLPLDMADATTRELLDGVKTANAVLAGHHFTGCTPPVLFRTFRQDFTLGGRWITAGAMPIQRMNAAERLHIQIDGLSVAEVDVRASQLSILAAFAGMAELADGDPYAFPGAPWWGLPNARDVVKGVAVAALGAGKLPARWPMGMRDKLAIPDGLEVADIAAALKARYPFLARAPDVLGVPRNLVGLRLQALEAAALSMALGCAWAADVPAVPVHDSVLVPSAAARLAAGWLQEAYRAQCAGAVVRCKIEEMGGAG